MARAAPPKTNVCPKCGEDFICAAANDEKGCWCAGLPHVMPCCGGSDAACFCPNCLQEAIDACQENECASS